MISKTRLSASLLFLMNGYITGSWATRIPDFLAQLQIGESTFGLLLLIFGVGSLVFIPCSGYWVNRYGSATLSKGMAIPLSFMPLLLIWVTNLWVGSVILFTFGGVMGGMDVAMNANAVEVEKKLQRPIMSSCHACWSLGGLIGSLCGSTLLETWGRLPYAIGMVCMAWGLLVIALPLLLDEASSEVAGQSTFAFPKNVTPWLLGIIALFSMIPEGLMVDWGAIYVHNDLGASIRESGYSFAIFSTAMMTVRFLGDVVRQSWGAVKTLRIGAILAISGLILLTSVSHHILVLIGFAFMGLGLSNLIPITYSAAGNLPDNSGMGLVVATSMGYSGILVAPPLIGFAAEQVGLTNVFLATISLLVCILMLSHHTVHAEALNS